MFPSGPASGNWGVAYTGISLRDYFAAHAMHDVFSHFNWTEESISNAAMLCYEAADAMIKAREPKS